MLNRWGLLVVEPSFPSQLFHTKRDKSFNGELSLPQIESYKNRFFHLFHISQFDQSICEDVFPRQYLAESDTSCQPGASGCGHQSSSKVTFRLNSRLRWSASYEGNWLPMPSAYASGTWAAQIILEDQRAGGWILISLPFFSNIFMLEATGWKRASWRKVQTCSLSSMPWICTHRPQMFWSRNSSTARFLKVSELVTA